MDYFVKNWNNTSIRYDQENNVIELFLKKMKAAKQSSFKLESCGVEGAACAVEAVDAEWIIPLPEINGMPYLGYGDMFFNYLNSLYVEHILPVNSTVYPNNEIIDNLGFVIMKFSNAGAKVYEYTNTLMIDFKMKFMLKRGSAVVLSYLTDYETGHYITVVKWDDTKEVFICYDSWKGNKHCKNGGVLEEYSRDFFIKRARPRLLEVWKK